MSNPASGRAAAELPPSTIAPRARPVPPPTVTMTTATDPTSEACPGCRQTEGVQLTSATPRVTAWTCTCGLSWATSVVNQHLRPQYPVSIAAALDEITRLRRILAQIITLADDAPTLTDDQLRDRLITLARSVSFTMETYMHGDLEADREVAQALASVILAGLPGQVGPGETV